MFRYDNETAIDNRMYFFHGRYESFKESEKLEKKGRLLDLDPLGRSS